MLKTSRRLALLSIIKYIILFYSFIIQSFKQFTNQKIILHSHVKTNDSIAKQPKNSLRQRGDYMNFIFQKLHDCTP